ncbi:glycosyltransferase [Flavobacterium circumlabens]|uniref:Glycosyltransferase n=1 Tax=Flavobacterium circumlabens TaxID=2133765 RepID=A0A4Y7UIS8_9FLAO|nr:MULTISPECIES: glycosyltransferase [Flavobacterium]QSB27324.1 glycosyltransferase [Flavobacterium sp. CLA17]TCN61182.1 glycosyltransferase involved in cell wall biosynthesis [Flavobacterium circumlabens]TEB46284.1 glycosyltransferase [Flavobacterium circumlabens]
MNNSAVLLIPYFNNSEGLLRSLRSIDPDEEIDVIIVDDGSVTDKFDEAVVRSNFKARGIILFEYLKSNKGIETALNSGLKISIEKKYKYIARLDCGDSCLGKRFAVQKAFLEENPEVKIVGSNVLAVDTNGHFLYSINLPLEDRNIKKKMYLNSMLIHPAVMFCSEILDSVSLYPLDHKFAEDYAFFFTISRKYKMANMEEYLTQIEINANGISLKKRKQQVKSRITIIKKHFYFGFYPIYGLLRNYVLLFLPYNLILSIKKIRK